mgnify:CR=1 FL=1
MKFSSVRYLIKEGFKGAWANRLMSLASVGVLVACMVVIGLAILISENVNMAIGKLEKQNVVQVYLKDYAWAYLWGEKPETEEAKDENGIADSYYLIHNEEEALAAAAPYYDFYRPVLLNFKYCDRVLLEGVT